MKKKLSAITLALILCVTTLSPAASATNYGSDIDPNTPAYTQTFSDVQTDHWAFQYIAEMVNRGAVAGYPDGTYRPNKTVTRAEFAKIMLGAAGLTATPAAATSYADVPTTNWASPFVETAKPYMTAFRVGTSLYFKPSTGALREDIAVAVVKLKGYDTRTADVSLLDGMFSDVSGISSAAQPYVALAVENNLISGYPDGTFRGQGTITRAEAAAVLWRAFQQGNDDKVIPGDPSTPNTPTQPENPGQTQPETPSEPTTPTTPTTPAKPETPKYAYSMDTVARNFKEYHTMVLTDSNEVYYIDDNVLGSTTSSTTLDLTSDFQYPLNKDDKNMDFALDRSSAYLGYDKTSGKVYLFANGSKQCMKVFDVTDLSNPTVIMADDMNGMDYGDNSYSLAFGYRISPECYCLSNGAFLIPPCQAASGVWDGTYMIYPTKASVDVLNLRFGYRDAAGSFNTITDDTVFFFDGSKEMLKTAPIQSMSNTQEFSVEGDIPGYLSSCAGPNGLYFWSGDKGLCYIDKEGWRHCTVPASEIECKDFLPLPIGVANMRVNQNGSCVLYDDTTESIRILEKQN